MGKVTDNSELITSLIWSGKNTMTSSNYHGFDIHYVLCFISEAQWYQWDIQNQWNHEPTTNTHQHSVLHICKLGTGQLIGSHVGQLSSRSSGNGPFSIQNFYSYSIAGIWQNIRQNLNSVLIGHCNHRQQTLLGKSIPFPYSLKITNNLYHHICYLKQTHNLELHFQYLS